VKRILRVETLNDDLLSLLHAVGVEPSPTDAAQWGKDNMSFRHEYPQYYDEETSRLVESRDRFIIDRFGYQPLWDQAH
jgi:hypothetical protein